MKYSDLVSTSVDTAGVRYYFGSVLDEVSKSAQEETDASSEGGKSKRHADKPDEKKDAPVVGSAAPVVGAAAPVEVKKDLKKDEILASLDKFNKQIMADIEEKKKLLAKHADDVKVKVATALDDVKAKTAIIAPDVGAKAPTVGEAAPKVDEDIKLFDLDKALDALKLKKIDLAPLKPFDFDVWKADTDKQLKEISTSLGIGLVSSILTATNFILRGIYIILFIVLQVGSAFPAEIIDEVKPAIPEPAKIVIVQPPDTIDG